ncbi:MAG: DUF6152 family protein, partial [Gammaproteobacteria bacterium]
MNNIAYRIAALLYACSTAAAFGHHSVAYFSEEVRSIQGVLKEVRWQNPHVTLTIEVPEESGGMADWHLEANSIYNLQRSGVTADRFTIGEVIRVTGRMSARQENVILTSEIELSSGELLVMRDAEGDYGLGAPPDTAAESRGIFRVWSVPRPSGRKTHFPFREEALTGRAAFDMLDNFALRCEPEGMPRIMLNPHPFEFVDNGATIVLRTELYDIERTIHMDTAASPADQSNSHLGYSIGRWEDGNLVVETTNIDWPYFDRLGTPQSERVALAERFSLSEDQSKIDYFITITDPETFVEPATVSGQWLALGESILNYDCQPY